MRRMLICVAVLLGLQPVIDKSIWWHVARGREALTFNPLPSASLLSADVSAEADWLSGIPTTLAFDLAGLHGLMILQLLLAVAIVVVLVRSADWRSGGFHHWLMLPALTVLCNRSLPLPASLTLLAIPLVWQITRDYWREPDPPHLAKLFVSIVLAVNFAPGLLWLLVAVVAASVLRRESAIAETNSLRFWQCSCAALIACCVNPRGIFAFRDAFVLAFPQTLVSRAYLIDTRLDVLLSSEDRFTTALFIALTVLVVIQFLHCRVSLTAWLIFGFLQFCAWSCTSNLLPVTVLVVLVAAASRTNSKDVNVSRMLTHSQRFQPAAFAVTSCLLVAVCALGIVDQDRRLGWGIAPSLDYRPLERDLSELDFEGTVLADDLHGAGTVALLDLSGITAHDTSERALLGGRWPSRWHLWDDIAHQRRMPYDRDDGTTGGWWLPLRDQDVSLLLVNSQHRSTIRALETTSWRMLSLDSPVIPFGFSGDAVMVEPITQCWNDRQLVDYGPWQYAFPGESVNWSGVGSLSLFGRQVLNLECQRLAGVFQALGMYRASAKILAAALQHQTSQSVIDQLQGLNFQKAISERQLASRASHWTAWLAMFPGTEETDGNDRSLLRLGYHPQRVPGQSRGKLEPLAADNSWHLARTLYFAGQLDDAMRALDSTDPETLYARAQLMFELGKPELAIATLTKLKSSECSLVLTLLATHELKSAK